VGTIYELQVRPGDGIFAVPYRAGRRRSAVRLPDGAIVEAPLPDQRADAPEHPDGFLAIGHGGVPATIHHVNLGLVVGHRTLTGVFLLPSGEVAAIYGADAVPLDVAIAGAP
jgi:hypothetical protein